MTNFTTLTADLNTPGSIKNICNYGALDPVQVLHQCETAIFRHLRVREMTTVREVTLPQGRSYIEILEDWELQDPIYLQSKNQLSEIENVMQDELLRARAFDSNGVLLTSPPTVYCLFNGRINFPNNSDREYMFDFHYYTTAGLHITEENQETFITKKHYDLLYPIIRAIGASYRNDMQQEQMFMQQFLAKLNSVAVEDDLTFRSAVGGGGYDV